MTFSIIGRERKAIGVGVVSGSTGVRDRVPWVKKDVGAIATQGYTETRYGIRGLSLLERGENLRKILRKLTREDPDPERRQVAIMDSSGKKAVHTGSSCPRKRSSIKGTDFVAVGNMLENKKTVSAMGEKFGESERKLPSRIIEALKAGAEAGGDRRGTKRLLFWLKGKAE